MSSFRPGAVTSFIFIKREGKMASNAYDRSGICFTFFRILTGLVAATALAFTVVAQQEDKARDSQRGATSPAPSSPAADPQARERCIAERRVDCDDPSVRARELDPAAVPPPPRVRPPAATPPPTGPKPSPR
jgi:hypothetical protein